MKSTTPLFPGFHIHTLRKRRRSPAKLLADQLVQTKKKSVTRLQACFGSYLPLQKLKPKAEGAHSRQRIYSLANTFWMFFSQILEPEGGCREAVSKLQAHAAENDISMPSASTAAYSRARGKLTEEDLQPLFDYLAHGAKQDCTIDYVDCRRVIVVDGTGLSMPDTESNQLEWPQMTCQKPGCGFPAMTISALFCLKNSTVISYASGSKHDSEQKLFRAQWDALEEGDILLGDKLYGSYFDLAMLSRRGIDSVTGFATNRRKPTKTRNAIQKLGPGDLLVEWKKPERRSATHANEDWQMLPETIKLRQIKMTVTGPHGRRKTFYVITTLLDHKKYSAESLLKLYRHRWEVELFFRDIKSTMKMDVLRCKTPSMIKKEVLMYFIVYNCMRRLILDASEEHQTESKRISFKAALQTVRSWAPFLDTASPKQKDLLLRLREAIAYSSLLARPGRHEPRCLKRRPHSYQRLNAYRSLMVQTSVKGRYHVKPA